MSPSQVPGLVQKPKQSSSRKILGVHVRGHLKLTQFQGVDLEHRCWVAFLLTALLPVNSCVSAVLVVTTCASVTPVRPAQILFSQRKPDCSGIRQTLRWQGGDRRTS